MVAFTALDVATVTGALSAAVVSIIGAIFAGLNRRELKTSNGRHIGEMVEETHTAATVAAAKAEEAAAAAVAAVSVVTEPTPSSPLPGERQPPA